MSKGKVLRRLIFVRELFLSDYENFLVKVEGQNSCKVASMRQSKEIHIYLKIFELLTMTIF